MAQKKQPKKSPKSQDPVFIGIDNDLLKEMEEHRRPLLARSRDEAWHFRDRLSKLLHKAAG
jgi:hypothetical protein